MNPTHTGLVAAPRFRGAHLLSRLPPTIVLAAPLGHGHVWPISVCADLTQNWRRVRAPRVPPGRLNQSEEGGREGAHVHTPRARIPPPVLALTKAFAPELDRPGTGLSPTSASVLL